MNTQELDEAINRQMEAAIWPWWFAVAYSQDRPKRQEAMRAGVEGVRLYAGSGIAHASAIGCIVQAITGQDLTTKDLIERLPEIEGQIWRAVGRDNFRAFGRRVPNGDLEELPPTAWPGGEVDYDDTCDLVKGGWRNSSLLHQTFGADRVVRFFDLHVPGQAVIAYVDKLETQGRLAAVDQALVGDYETFAGVEACNPQLEVGFWDAFTACAWVASRSPEFTAAAQTYGRENHAERGGPHSAAAWLVVGNLAGGRYGVTLTQALHQLQVAISSDKLGGGTALNLSTGRRGSLIKDDWDELALAYLHDGLQLLDGYVGHKWASVEVQRAFPASAMRQEPEPKTEASGRGRQSGVGGYTIVDAALLEEMRDLIAEGQASSEWEAAGQVVARAKGGGSDDSKKKRLTKKFKALHSV